MGNKSAPLGSLIISFDLCTFAKQPNRKSTSSFRETHYRYLKISINEIMHSCWC